MWCRPLPVCCAVFILGVWPDAFADDSPTKAAIPWSSGPKFEWVLDQPLVATWQNSELGFAVRDLGEQRRIPVIFDRRLDPNLKFSLETKSESLRDVLRQMAKLASGGVSISSQTVYLGPTSSAGKLRTLIALRHAEVQKVIGTLPTSRRKHLTERHPLNWADLDTPHDIVQRLIVERGLKVKGLELIPHDLWGPAEVPPLPLAEALTLVLIQFDLTFRLDQTGTEVELVPIPEQVAVEKKWLLPRARVQDVARAIADELPQVAAETTTEDLVAQGTEEDLESLDRIIHKMIGATPPRAKSNSPPALSRRRLTFQAKDAPLSAILEKLAGTGIQFDYDRAALKKSGIDMDQLVEIDVKGVAPTELFDKLFKPLKLAYQVDGLRVTLTAEGASN